MNAKAPIRIGMIAGETSGDQIGANLLQALKQAYPDAIFEGIGGEQMLREGFHSFFPMERLSVMGLIEPLKRLPELISIRRFLKNHFIQNPPDLFIGIDAPDFNLGLAKQLKQKGIKTAHYVSPTVWAWRKRRIHQIKKSIDLMLTLFPFENAIYEQHQIPVACVGHPLADVIPLESSQTDARTTLGLPLDKKIIALLPGSRAQELNFMLPEFFKTAQILKQKDSSLEFITATANEARRTQFLEISQNYSELKVHDFSKQATAVMAASDVILVTSGTASLQAMLVKRPTLIAYKMSPWVFQLAKLIVKVPYIGLPNLLANALIMPEFIQDRMNAELMADQVWAYLQSNGILSETQKQFETLHLMLKRQSSEAARKAIQATFFNQ